MRLYGGSAPCGRTGNHAADVQQTVDEVGGVDGARIDQLVIDAWQLVRLHHNAHAALANVQRPQVAVQRVCSLRQPVQQIAAFHVCVFSSSVTVLSCTVNIAHLKQRLLNCVTFNLDDMTLGGLATSVSHDVETVQDRR